MTDEGAMTGGVVGDVVDDVPRSAEMDGVSQLVAEVTYGVDGLVVVPGAPASDGVEVLEAEAEGVDDTVAGHAGAALGELGDLFPHAQAGIKTALVEAHGHLGRLQ